jgi:hypothetical protein
MAVTVPLAEELPVWANDALAPVHAAKVTSMPATDTRYITRPP